MKFNRNYLFLIMFSFAGCIDQSPGGKTTPAPKDQQEPKPKPQAHPKAPPKKEPTSRPTPKPQPEAPRQKPKPNPEKNTFKPDEPNQKKPGLYNPTWPALKQFLEEDKGDLKTYVLNSYNCQHFSRALKVAARKRGFRAAYVSLMPVDGTVGHAITAFDTPDNGLIYIEPQHDQVAYVRPWTPYGSIPIEHVKSRYFACPANTHDLIHPLKVKTYKGNIFEYDYYTNYKARADCLDAHVSAFNSAVEEYNRTMSAFSRYQIDSWQKNLKLLILDIGLKRPTSPGMVVFTITDRW
jgi:hypothetical protein